MRKIQSKIGMLLAACIAAASGAHAQDMGKLLATGGVSQVEGAGGGGLTPWALITSYGTTDSYGANAYATRVSTTDYALSSYGVAVGIRDRVELSFATQDFTGDKAPLDQLRIKQDIVGVKVRVYGDAVYDQALAMPQIAVGLQYKRNKGIAGLEGLGVTNVTQLGAVKDSGTDLYVSATKLYLAQSLLVNGTLRYTKANQMGLLGFGGDKKDRYQPMLEASLAYLVTRKLVVGAEYRMKPNNLGVDDKEGDYKDLFVAYFPNRNLSLTAAYVDLGEITIFNSKKQRGWYLSAQVGF